MARRAESMVTLPDGERWPTLGLGTWRLGEQARQQEREAELVQQAIELGYRLIDTAEMYGEGGAERVVGMGVRAALRQPGLSRKHLVIVSKVYPHHADTAGMLRACESSLHRLHVDYIDLYLLHWRGGVALAETLNGFDELRRRGWIRHWGVSNFALADLRELKGLTADAKCASNQVYYSLSERGVEFDVLPWMRRRSMPLMAYCPIDGGTLPRHRGLTALAQPLGLSAAQLALAWVASQPGVIAIPKAAKLAHLVENWHVRQIDLDLETRKALDAMFPAPTQAQPLAMR
ncbi:MAG: aldo/keto reductase [Burkholderiaceae bacterium]